MLDNKAEFCFKSIYLPEKGRNQHVFKTAIKDSKPHIFGDHFNLFMDKVEKIV